jgi:AFG3 family protein
MILEYGMNKSIGYFSFPQTDYEKPYSEGLSQKIDEQAKNIINIAYERTEKILLEKKEGLIKIAELLIKNEKIDAEDMLAVLGPRPESAFSEENLNSFLKSKKQSKNEKLEKLELV